MDIRGRNAWVTGAGSGIGQAIALALAARGARAVHLVDRDPRGLEATAGLLARSGARAALHALDVTDLAALERAFELADADVGLDIVVNNAGISSNEEFSAATLERIALVLAVNLTAVIAGTQLAVRLMRRRGRGGVVVNTASTAALAPYERDPVYCASKMGVVRFTESCRALAAQCGVRVNAVCPGITDTPLIRSTGGDGIAPWLKARADAVVVLTPGDIANGVLTLIEDDTQAGAVLVLANRPRTP
jgi:3-oxoacyl-[acyl-carrier protein] reductase